MTYKTHLMRRAVGEGGKGEIEREGEMGVNSKYETSGFSFTIMNIPCMKHCVKQDLTRKAILRNKADHLSIYMLIMRGLTVITDI